MISSRFRGHQIELRGDQWFYIDTDEPTIETYKERPCGHCGMYDTVDGHDGCLGTLPGIINACCGHGRCDEAYLQFEDGSIISGSAASAQILDINNISMV